MDLKNFIFFLFVSSNGIVFIFFKIKNRDIISEKDAVYLVPYKSVIIVKSGVRKLYVRVTEQEHELSR